MSRPPSETNKRKVLRLFYALGLLILLQTFPARIFDYGHNVQFWIVTIPLMLAVFLWHDFAQSPTGQKILSSAFVERLTLILVGCIIAFVVAELFTRTDLAKHHLLGLFNEPAAIYQNNEYGFRDETHPVERPPEVDTRILILGDSFTYGQAVDYEEIYPNLLREQAGPSVEIIVAAKGGASTVKELQFLREYGCQFSPDIVIVGIVPNDLQEADENMPTQQKEWEFFGPLANKLYLRGLHLPYVFDYYLNRLGEGFGWRYSYVQWESDIFQDEYIAAWEEVIRELAEESGSCGASHLYAFTLPQPLNYADADILSLYETRYQVMADAFEQAGFEAINLFPAYLEEFGDQPFKPLWAVPNDAHPGPEIHAWYAAQIWAHISDTQ